MITAEFIDTYSDDLITIHEARSAIYTHPLRPDYAFAETLLDPSFCRILVVFAVAGIETMLESWRSRDRLSVLDKYFASRKVPNAERIESVYQAFLDAGVQVDKDVFDDYLAIKYLRNTIVHGRWYDHERDWLDARGFPADTRKLTKQHMEKIERVNQNMMFYIALTGLTDPSTPKPASLIKLNVTNRKDETGILSKRDIERIIWNNLERIDAHIYADIAKTASTKQYDWTEGRADSELAVLGREEWKRLFYLAARRASEENYSLLAQHRNLAAEALEFWREYLERSLAPRPEDVRAALDVFESPDFDPRVPEWSVVANIPEDAADPIVRKFLPNPGSLTSEKVVYALHAGKKAFELLPNITPAILLTVHLPIIDPANTLAYLCEAERALDMLRLCRSWYECIEYRRKFTGASLDFYVRMCREFAGRAPVRTTHGA